MTVFTVGRVSPRQLRQPRQPPIGPILCRKPITETLFPGRHVDNENWPSPITQALHTVRLNNVCCSFVIYILYGSCLSVFTFLQPLLGLQSHRRLLLNIHLSLSFLLAIFFFFLLCPVPPRISEFEASISHFHSAITLMDSFSLYTILKARDFSFGRLSVPFLCPQQGYFPLHLMLSNSRVYRKKTEN